MESDPQEPRPLTGVERRLLDALLALDFEGVEALRRQAETVQAYSSCSCGCGSIGFEHPDGVRPPPQSHAAPLNPIVHNGEGSDVGGLILFLSDGMLQDLEVYSFRPDPLPLPEPEFVRLEPF